MRIRLNTFSSNTYLFLSGTFISYLGNGVQTIASAYLTFLETESILAIGQLFVLISIPEALISTYFGGLVDRFNRKWICVWTDFVRGGMTLLLPLSLMLGYQSVWIIYLTNFLIALGDAVFTPASNALAQEIVPEKQYTRFSISYEVVLQAGTLLSVAVGGLLADLLGVSLVLLLNSLSYVISGTLFGLIRYQSNLVQNTKDTHQSTSWRKLLQMMRNRLWKSRVLGFGLLFSLINVIIIACNTMLIPLVVQKNNDSMTVLGLTDAFSGIGMVLAGVLFAKMTNKLDEHWLVCIGYLVCAAFLILLPHGGTLWVIACTTPSAISFGIARIGLRSLIYKHIEIANAGKFFGFFNALGLVLAALTAFFASQGTVQMGYLLIAIVVAVITGIGFRFVAPTRQYS